jgi:hypothetical protein
MNLIDAYYQPGVIDCYTFVFDERDSKTEYYTMIATDETGATYSQWTEGVYDPNGANEHLGVRVLFQYLGKVLVDHVLDRMNE